MFSITPLTHLPDTDYTQSLVIVKQQLRQCFTYSMAFHFSTYLYYTTLDFSTTVNGLMFLISSSQYPFILFVFVLNILLKTLRLQVTFPWVNIVALKKWFSVYLDLSMNTEAITGA